MITQRRVAVMAAAVIATVGLLQAGALPARAAAFTVTRSDDPTPGPCLPSDCSLREAIIAANLAPNSTITLPGGIFTITIGGTDNPATNAAVGDLDILVGMTITGAGRNSTFVQSGSAPGNGIHRVFDNHSPILVTISGLTARYGRDVENESGGCIRNLGVLTLDSITATECSSTAGGAGIGSYKTLTIRDSIVSTNTLTAPVGAVRSGGGVANGPNSTATIIRTQILNNVATTSPPAQMTYGGGFANTGTMTISESLISGNYSMSTGGGISTNQLTITDSIVRDNRARFDVGGLDNDGDMTVRSTSFINNESGYQCSGTECDKAFVGGLLNTTQGTLNVENSTFTGNKCVVNGGGIMNSDQGTLRIANTTISGNTCGVGAGMSGGGAATYLKNSIVAGNTPLGDGGDCHDHIQSQGYNIIGTMTGCALHGNTTGNVTGVLDPKLSPIADNGGATPTMALKTDSPALNAGDPAGCTNTANVAFVVDQRAFSRPEIGRCDAGAYERQPSVILWSGSNAAMAWQLNGNTFVRMKGFGGPGDGWTAQSLTREPNGYYEVLWTADNLAHLWRMTPSDTFESAIGLEGPGPGWTATSVVRAADGGYEFLWTRDGGAQIWKITAERGWGGSVNLGGPAGWRATSYFRAGDGTRRVLWSSDNQAMVWSLTSSGGWIGQQGFGGPGAGWSASSYTLNDDGTFEFVWTRDAAAAIWKINGSGTFNSLVGLGGPTGWSVQSYFFK